MHHPLFGPVPGVMELTIILFLAVLLLPLVWVGVQFIRAGYHRLTDTDDPDAAAPVFVRRVTAALVDSLPAGVLATAAIYLVARVAHRIVYTDPAGSDLTFAGFTIALVAYSLYFLGFELAWTGQTPGKRLLDIHVTTLDHEPADGRAIIIRNLLRPIDLFFTYLPVLAVIALTDQNQRLGDLAAHTTITRTTAVDTAPDRQPASAHPQ